MAKFDLKQYNNGVFSVKFYVVLSMVDDPVWHVDYNGPSVASQDIYSDYDDAKAAFKDLKKIIKSESLKESYSVH